MEIVLATHVSRLKQLTWETQDLTPSFPSKPRETEMYFFKVRLRHAANHRALSAPSEMHPMPDAPHKVRGFPTTMCFVSG